MIDYQKYYKQRYNLAVPNQFRVNITGTHITITKSGSGIPLIQELVRDLPGHVWVYQYNEPNSLGKDVRSIKKIIGDALLNVREY